MRTSRSPRPDRPATWHPRRISGTSPPRPSSRSVYTDEWVRTTANLLPGAGEEVKFDRGKMDFKVSIPEQVQWKVELELGDEECELEIELKW
jgi:hypothetical protein